MPKKKTGIVLRMNSADREYAVRAFAQRIVQLKSNMMHVNRKETPVTYNVLKIELERVEAMCDYVDRGF